MEDITPDYSSPSAAASQLSALTPDLVKGAARTASDVVSRATDLETSIRKAVDAGVRNPASVTKSFNPQFMGNFGSFASQGNAIQELKSVLETELGKSIQLTSPLSSGFVPFDLAAPARILAPMETVLANRLPRTPGAGTSKRVKLITGFTGSNTGGLSSSRISIGEGNVSSYPMVLPPEVAATAIDVSVPYAFLGRTESVSMLAQWAGKGFEDIASLANLLLLSAYKLGEEDLLISGNTSALATPAAPTVISRTAGSGEVGQSGVTSNVSVKVVARNLFGGTAASAAGSVASTNGNVVDVVISPVAGALQYDLYVGTGASPSTWYFFATTGAAKFTLTGAVPSSGTTAPGADSGTASSQDFNGLASIITGQASATYGGLSGAYVNQSVGTVLNMNAINAGLAGMYNSGFRANPDFILTSGVDAANLSTSLQSAAGGAQGYKFNIDATDPSNIKAGGAVSAFVNPATRKTVDILVSQRMPQGNAALVTEKVNNTTLNSGSVTAMEIAEVQSPVSIAWPQIDLAYRFSMVAYEALVCSAPVLQGWLGGLQATTGTGPFA